jgi:predicted signal transduction protein with EAL and GGDEF domain
VRVALVAGLTGIVLRRLVQTINTYAAGEHAARELAYSDQLTGLGNRQALHERLRDELPAAASVGDPVSVLFFDLDGFKLVNDSYGHAVGDELLVARPGASPATCGPATSSRGSVVTSSSLSPGTRRRPAPRAWPSG